jgi:hypothetical protein
VNAQEFLIQEQQAIDPIVELKKYYVTNLFVQLKYYKAAAIRGANLNGNFKLEVIYFLYF